jgi:hypothetical protein
MLKPLTDLPCRGKQPTPNSNATRPLEDILKIVKRKKYIYNIYICIYIYMCFIYIYVYIYIYMFYIEFYVYTSFRIICFICKLKR